MLGRKEIDKILSGLKPGSYTIRTETHTNGESSTSVRIASNVPGGTDLSGIETLVFIGSAALGANVKLPEAIMLEGRELSHLYDIPEREVDLPSREREWIAKTNFARFTIFPKGDFTNSGVKEIYMNSTTVYFQAGIKLPKDVQLRVITKALTYSAKDSDKAIAGHGYTYVKGVDICGHIPSGLDLSNLDGVTIKQISSIGKGVKFPKSVQVSLGVGMSIPDGTDLSEIEDLHISGNLGKNVKLPKKVSASWLGGYIPDGLDLSKTDPLSFESPVTFGQGVKLPKVTSFRSYGKEPVSIGGHIPDNLDLSYVDIDPASIKNIKSIGRNVRFTPEFSKKYAKEIKKLRVQSATDRVPEAATRFKGAAQKLKQSIRKIFRGNKGNEM